jgi:hypothetical protein
MSLDLTGSGVGERIHNPITNPIPGVIQNPYISKQRREAAHNRSVFGTVAVNSIL